MYTNTVVLGRFSQDVKFDYVKNGELARAMFSIATNPPRQKDKTIFYNCTALGKPAELINQLTNGNAKGREVFLTGFIDIQSYDKEVNGTNIKMYPATFMVDTFQLLSNPQGNQQSNQSGQQQQQQQNQQQNRGNGFQNQGQQQQNNGGWGNNTQQNQGGNNQSNNNQGFNQMPELSDDDMPF